MYIYIYECNIYICSYCSNTANQYCNKSCNTHMGTHHAYGNSTLNTSMFIYMKTCIREHNMYKCDIATCIHATLQQALRSTRTGRHLDATDSMSHLDTSNSIEAS